MNTPSFSHRAFYDDDGNIILPSLPVSGPVSTTTSEQNITPVEHVITGENVIEPDAAWIIIEDNPAQLHPVENSAEETAAIPSHRVPVSDHIREHIIALRTITRGAVREGANQYQVSIISSVPLFRRATDDLSWFFGTAWNFLAQPVWVPGRKKTIKQYSRGTLFLLDIVRFGGTFTAIFLALFVTLNYDSFWQITQSKFSMIMSGPTIESTDTDADSAMIETLKQGHAQSADARERGELLSFLPGVGPPDNRILIPKLRLNIPLVTPSIESLLRQDWVQVETDIQSALEQGVVHYPGTAKPGQAGNFFVTGHSSYYPWAPGQYKTVFARLHDLKPGDEYWVYFKGDRHRYVIKEKKEVSPADITVLDQPEDRRVSTLMTCTPIGTTLRRLVLIAQEVDPITGKELQVGERGEKAVAPKLQLEALPI